MLFPSPGRVAGVSCSDFVVESLEARRMMAGNVTAVVRNGDLIVRGDRNDNIIAITTESNGIRISGFLSTNGEDTTINGQGNVTFTGLNLVQDDLRISMRGGDDVVIIELLVQDDVRITMGGGTDRVDFTSLMGGNLTVSMGANAGANVETVTIADTRVNQETRIRGSRGGHDVTLSNNFFVHSTNITLGGGDDALRIDPGHLFFELRDNGSGGTSDVLVTPFAPDLQTIRGFETIHRVIA